MPPVLPFLPAIAAATTIGVDLLDATKKQPKFTQTGPAAADTIPGSPLDVIGGGAPGGLKGTSLGAGGGGIPGDALTGVLQQIAGGIIGKPGGMTASPAAATGPAGVGAGGKGIAPPANIGGGGIDAFGGNGGLPWLQNIQGPTPGTPEAVM